MTAFDYSSLITRATALLTRFGQQVTITYSSSESYTVATQTNAKTTSTFTGYGVILDYRTTEIDDVQVLQNDRRLILQQTSIAPQVDNTVTDANSVVYKIMDVETISPSGTDVIYICQLRI